MRPRMRRTAPRIAMPPHYPASCGGMPSARQAVEPSLELEEGLLAVLADVLGAEHQLDVGVTADELADALRPARGLEAAVAHQRVAAGERDRDPARGRG